MARLAAAAKVLASAEGDQRDLLESVEQCLQKLRDPVRVAIGGEFSSGKSSLVNMMLGSHVVIPSADASAIPTVRFSYSARPVKRLIKGSETLDLEGELELSRSDLLLYRRMEVGLDVSLLKELEIFDTPGTSDPNRTEDQIRDITRRVDFLIWCTNATNAWRQSERRLFSELADAMHHRSILVVTHVDLPKVKASLDRLMMRLRKEVGSKFQAVVPMDILTATKARSATGEIMDRTGWTTSGGEPFVVALQDAIDTIYNQRAAAAEAALESSAGYTHELLADSRTDSSAKPVIDISGGPEIPRNPESFFTAWEACRRDYLGFLGDAGRGDDGGTGTGTCDLLRAFGTAAGARSCVDQELHREVVARLTEAADYLEAVGSKAESNGFPDRARAVLAQLDWEFHRLIEAT